jgi:hypothetical protein
MSTTSTENSTQVYNDNRDNFATMESLAIICKTPQEELKTFSEIYFAVHTIFTKNLGNDFTFSKIDFKTEYEKNI